MKFTSDINSNILEGYGLLCPSIFLSAAHALVCRGFSVRGAPFEALQEPPIDFLLPFFLFPTRYSLLANFQNFAFLGVLGNGSTSRILAMPDIYISARENPRPKPACGTVP